MSGNSPSRMGVREVGALLNESAQADAVGHGRPVEGIPVINGGEDVNLPVQLSLMDDLRLHCRKLFLKHHEVHAHIGAHAFEKNVTQRLWINVELWVPLAQSTPSADQLHEVVDYDFVRTEVAARLAQGHIELQETLCDDLAERLLAHPGVRAVRLSTSKPDVYPDCETVGVEVFRLKPDFNAQP